MFDLNSNLESFNYFIRNHANVTTFTTQQGGNIVTSYEINIDEVVDIQGNVVSMSNVNKTYVYFWAEDTTDKSAIVIDSNVSR